MDINKIKFIEHYGRSQSDKEISITMLKTDDINIVLRGAAVGSILNIWNDGSLASHIMVALAGDRFYFRGTNSCKGFRVTSNSQSKNKYCRIHQMYLTDDMKEWILRNEGDFELHYDAESKLYYVEPEIKFAFLNKEV